MLGKSLPSAEKVCGGRPMAKKEGMLVEIVVKVKAATRIPQSRVSEERLEEETVSVVAECLAKEKSIDFLEASLLDFQHCKLVFEDGMPVNCGLMEQVRIFTDASWSYPYDDHGKPQHRGTDFPSLLRFIQRMRNS
jgi:hypothetical protein